MYVRAYDESNHSFYKSIVYGLLDIGYYEQAILFNPRSQSFELINYFKKIDEQLIPQYEIINTEKDQWVLYDKIYLLKFKKFCTEHGFMNPLTSFRGYDPVFQNFSFMLQILKDKKIHISNSDIPIRKPSDFDSWKYVNTQEDASSFMGCFVGFHDSKIEKMQYYEKD